MANAMTEAKPSGGRLTIRDRLKDPAIIAEIGKAMPAHCKPDRMARIALTALNRTPKLTECTQESFFECLLSLSQWGLEPDGRRAHLIPYGNVCTLIIDYKGLVELAFRSGVVKSIHADVVRDGDVFEFNRGQVTLHVPHFLRRDAEKPKEPGKVYAAYCFAELQGGATKTEVLSYDEIEGIRKRSRAGRNGPWVSDWNEMAKKTCFRRVSKWLPLSAEILDAFDHDDDRLETAQSAMQAPQTVSQLTQSLTGATTNQMDSLEAEFIEAERLREEAEKGDAAE